MLFFGLISSDQPFCRAIGQQLREEGVWQLAVFASLEEALASWSGFLPSLIFWDAETAPQGQGQTLTDRLAAEDSAPFLLLMGDLPEGADAADVTEAFARPLRLGALLARLAFYARLLKQSPDASLELGRWFFLPRARLLKPRREGEAVKLTDKEAQLLSFLYAAPNPVAREDLLAEVWGYQTGIDTHTLETHIYRLRRKIMGAEPMGEDVFLTAGGGYRLNPLWRQA